MAAYRKLSRCFITAATERSFMKIMKHVTKDCVSDPEQVTLYTEETQSEASDYKRYKSARGTSALEAFHHVARTCVKAKSASADLYHHMLTLITWRWNVDRAVACKKFPNYGYYNYPKLQSVYKFRQRYRQYFKDSTTFALSEFPVIGEVDEASLETFGAKYSSSSAKQLTFDDEDEWEMSDVEEEKCDDETLAEYCFDRVAEVAPVVSGSLVVTNQVN